MPISRLSCNGAAMQQGNLPYKRKPKTYAAQDRKSTRLNSSHIL